MPDDEQEQGSPEEVTSEEAAQSTNGTSEGAIRHRSATGFRPQGSVRQR